MFDRKATTRDDAARAAAERDGRPHWLPWYWLILAGVGVYLGLRDLIGKARHAYRARPRPQRARIVQPVFSQRRAAHMETGESDEAEGSQEEVDEAADEPLPPEEIELEEGGIEHPRVRFEPNNAPLRAVLTIMACVIGFACFHYFAAWKFFHVLEARESQQKRSRLAPSVRAEPSPPAEPRIEQIDRFADIDKPNVNRRMSAYEATLDSYGPTDDDGFVRVPIERAMEQAIGRLPVRKRPSQKRQDKETKDQGLVNAGDSNSGRMFRERQ